MTAAERSEPGIERARGDIAVIGIGCRFAGGADSPDALWKLLSAGGHGIIPVPAERWRSEDWYHPERDQPGRMNFRCAGFLRDGIEYFDPAWFGIAPREAERMDPQQRLFLEVACEALDDAGIASDSLAGSRTGVFAGAYNGNYTLMARGTPDAGLIDGWSATGAHASIVAGRLAYLLGCTGPALVVDTACSSSLVAVHLAVQSLRHGECDLALAGGVHLLTAPEPLVASTKLGATSPSGRCRTFDAEADGFGHGEGAGLVVLKPLAAALADGDRVLGVIRGSAVNQDGRSNSLTAPNGPAQARVIRQALADAGVRPAEVAYVEAHGTATPLGDPIEVEALADALGEDRQRRLLLGSVKANLGHTEAAAGIAGLIKALLVLEHRQVPPQPGFSRLHPEIAALDAPIGVPTEAVALPADRLLVGVSAFGFSGTNAHVVLQAAAPAAVPAAAPGARVFAVSARSTAALEQAITRWSDCLRTSPADARALALASTAGRRHWPHRVAVVADSGPAAAEALQAAPRRLVRRAPRVALLCTGQGSQYPGMGQALYRERPAFRAALQRCAQVLDPAMGCDSLALLFGGEAIDQTGYAQPLLVAFELAMAALWREAGLRPVAVMGHSVGEIAAAALAGAMDEADALRLAVARGAAMQGLAEGGGMMAVFASADEVASLLPRAGGCLALAALNAARNTVVAGDLPALQRLQVQLEADGIDCRSLAVSHAFHSPLIEPALAPLAAALAGMRFAPPEIPLISNVDAAPLAALTADYWLHHARQPVRFADSLRALQGLQVDLLLEIGPDAVLTGLAGLSQPESERIASQRRGRGEHASLAEASAALYRAGVALDWRILQGEPGLAPARAPGPVFERSRYWLEVPGPRPAAVASVAAASPLDTDASGSALIYDFYDELTVLSQNYADAGDASTREEGHLTFGLLAHSEPGFSWVRALFEKDRDPQGHERLRQTQAALKAALFDEIDFSRIGRVFDYGCGHAADLASLALAHPHLHGSGYTLSAGQVEVGRRRLAALGLDQRIGVTRNDSSKAAFPPANDLIFGVEVTGLIADKPGLFRNIAAALAPGGLLVIADFVATREAIANPDTHSYTPVAREWAELLGHHGLRLARAVDASAPVANWLDDAEFEANVDSVVERYALSPLTRRHLLSNGNIGRALRADLMRYLLLRAVASPHESSEALVKANLAALSQAAALPSTAAGPPLQDWLYRVASVPAARLPAFDMPALGQAAEVESQRQASQLRAYRDTGEAMQALAQAWLLRALRQLGADSVDAAQRLPVAASQRRLLAHLLADLDEQHLAMSRTPEDAAALQRQTEAVHPEAAAELALLGRCGAQLADALCGRVDPLELLFPAGDASLAEALYERSPFSAALQRMAAAVCAALPRQQPLRVIEIGGGTGATTAQVLPVLPPGSRYLFTDIAPALVARAAERFVEHPLQTTVYDVQRPPPSAGLATAGFDLLLAANVLHATTDLDQALRHARDLLAPGGLLLLIENTGPFLWGDISFGLTPGMWAFADEAQRSHALIDTARWRQHLEAAGFEAIETFDPGHPGLHGISRQCLLLARRRVARRFALLGGPEALRQDLARALSQAGQAVAPDGALDAADEVLLLDGLEPGIRAQDCLTAAHALVLQAMACGTPPRLLLLDAGTPATACLQGMARAVAAELPEAGCRCITLAPDTPVAAQVALLLDALLHCRDDVRVAVGEPWAEQLQRMRLPEALPRLKADASYLVTGAFGGLGPDLVRWLYRQGARRLVLAGRSPPGAAVLGLQNELADAELRLQVADVCQPAAVQALVDAAQALAPLKGVFHAAGALADAALVRQTVDTMCLPLAPKLDGARALEQATAALALDWFVAFSSAAGLLAPFGQSNHAAAATALDGLMQARKARGLAALCIDWGAFGEVGAALRDGVETRVSDSGLAFMPPQAAFDAMGYAMSANIDRIVILDVDWTRYLRRYPSAGLPQLLDAAGQEARPAPTAGTAPGDRSGAKDLRARLASSPAGHRFELLCEAIRGEAARILQLPAAELDDEAPLREAGLDSLMSIEFRNRLSEAAGTRLGATLVFDHPSVRALAAHLSSRVFADLFDEAAAPRAAGDALGQLDAEALSALLAEELRELGSGH